MQQYYYFITFTQHIPLDLYIGVTKRIDWKMEGMRQQLSILSHPGLFKLVSNSQL